MGKNSPKTRQGMLSELERAIWLLITTDDYKVVARGDDWAELHYVHNSPPHPVTRIEIRTPPES